MRSISFRSPEKKGYFQIGSGNTIYSSAHGGSFGLTLQGSYAFTKDFFVSSNYLGRSTHFKKKVTKPKYNDIHLQFAIAHLKINFGS